MKKSTDYATLRRTHFLARKDVIIVASVSCIYGISSVEDYNGLSVIINKGWEDDGVTTKLLRQLTDIRVSAKWYRFFHRGTFRPWW
jgi:excinuclease ABC subunit B